MCRLGAQLALNGLNENGSLVESPPEQPMPVPLSGMPTIRSESLVYLTAYVLLNPLRAFVTVNDPSGKAETLIQ